MGHEGDDDVAQKTLSIGSFFSGASAQSGTGRAVLSLVESGGGERVFPINRNPTIIGRANNADVVLLDPTVSYFHARIIMHNFGYTVEDMDSAEGTFLRGERVNHARLRHGDMLRLGNTILTFADESATAAENAAQTTALVPDNATEKGLWIRPPARPGPYHEFRQVEMPRAESVQRELGTADSEDSAPSLDELLLKVIHATRYLRRRLWLIMGFMLVGGTLGAASFVYFPPVRAAYCVVTLRPAPRINPIEPETRTSPAEPTQFFEGAERAFLSRESIMGTLGKMGMPGASESWADAIAKRMRFETMGNYTYTAVLTPSPFGKRTDWHVRFLDAHLRNYIDSEIGRKMKSFVAEVDFLRTQTAAANQRLQDIAQQTVQFREANSDQILAQSTLGPGLQAELASKRIESSGRVDRLAGELEAVRSQLGRGSALSQAKSQSAQGDRDALRTIDRKLTELRAQGLADGHPDVQRLLNEQKNLQRMVDEHLHSDVTQFDKNANVAYDSLRSQSDQLGAQLRAARAERGTIDSGLHSLRAVSSRSPQVNARIEELTRMKEEAERQHGLLFDGLKKAEVHLELERVSTTSRYEIVVPARLESPPDRSRAFALRLAFGLLLGTLLITAVIGLGELGRRFARVAQDNAAPSASPERTGSASPEQPIRRWPMRPRR
jgi:pSer/pThr/pTyr-binding forkhead associated (FHA) protein